MTLVSCPYLQFFPSRAGKVTGACYTLLPSPLVGRFHIQTPQGIWAPPLQNTTLTYSLPPSVDIGGKQEANTLLGMYTVQ